MQVPSRRLGFGLVLGMFIAASILQAGWFGERKRSEETLIVTGNYLKSRLLAELIQYHTKHPILLLPNEENPDNIYFIPNKKESLMITRDQFKEFVETFHPKAVIFLGNEAYAPSEYREQIEEGLVATPVRNDDWSAIAEYIGKTMGISNLREEYEECLRKYDYKGRVIEGKSAKETMRDWPGGTITEEQKK